MHKPLPIPQMSRDLMLMKSSNFVSRDDFMDIDATFQKRPKAEYEGRDGYM